MKHLLEKEGLQALIHVAQAVNSHLKLDDVLAAVLRETTSAIEAEAASLILVDETTHDLVFHAVTGTKASTLQSFRLPAGTGIVGSVIDSRQSLISNDPLSDQRFYGKVDELTGFVTRSILCVPLTTGSRLWGALEVLNRRDGQPFSNEDLVLCEAIAGHAAIAIENAMLHANLLANERLAAFGETVAGLAHCIRNLLTGMEGGSDLVEQGLDRHDFDRISQGWRIVERNSGFIQELVLDMLDYARERRPEYHLIDINQFLSLALDDFSGSLELQKISFRWTPASGLPGVVVDSKGIQRCLLNLLSNAVDAVGGQPLPEIHVKVETSDNDSFSITVEDNGSGIPAEDIEALFKPFYSTKGSRGTGLGLAVTRKIVNEHGGRIHVQSAPGQGSSFRILLPRHGNAVVSLASPDRQSEALVEKSASTPTLELPAMILATGHRRSLHRQPRILIIDDDPDIQAILKFHLERFDNFSIDVASNGVEGIEKAHGPQPDLIILDLQMPHKDGFSTLRELKASDHHRDTPVIIITGIRGHDGNSLSTEEILRTTGHEPTACLEKPIDAQKLRSTVDSVLAMRLGRHPTHDKSEKSVARHSGQA